MHASALLSANVEPFSSDKYTGVNCLFILSFRYTAERFSCGRKRESANTFAPDASGYATTLRQAEHPRCVLGISVSTVPNGIVMSCAAIILAVRLRTTQGKARKTSMAG